MFFPDIVFFLTSMKIYKTCSSMSVKKRQERYLCSTPDNATMLNIISDKPKTATQSTVYSHIVRGDWDVKFIWISKNSRWSATRKQNFFPQKRHTKGRKSRKPQVSWWNTDHMLHNGSWWWCRKSMLPMKDIHGYPIRGMVSHSLCWHVPISESNQLSAVPRSRAQHAPMRS